MKISRELPLTEMCQNQVFGLGLAEHPQSILIRAVVGHTCPFLQAILKCGLTDCEIRVPRELHKRLVVAGVPAVRQ